MDELIFHIDRLGIFGRYSISATLLAGDTRTQRNYASYGPVLARRTKHDGKEHTRVELVPTLDDGGWLFVWHSRASPIRSADLDALVPYIHAKGNFLKVRRGALFAFNEHGELQAVKYFSIPALMNDDEREIWKEMQGPCRCSNQPHERTVGNGSSLRGDKESGVEEGNGSLPEAANDRYRWIHRFFRDKL